MFSIVSFLCKVEVESTVVFGRATLFSNALVCDLVFELVELEIISVGLLPYPPVEEEELTSIEEPLL